MINRFLSALMLALWAGNALAAEVRGSVLLDGPPPPARTITLRAKKGHPIDGCGSQEKESPRLRVGSGGQVRDAVVWMDGAPVEGSEVPGDAPMPVIDQNQCVFTPHVLAVAPGRSVAIRNSDMVIHNVRIFRDGEPTLLMHRWQKAAAADIPWRFEEPGRYVVRCGVHPWMYAWVFVAPGPVVAVTDDRGSFTLTGIPPGRHTLKVWHEALGSLEMPVEVEADGGEIAPLRFPPQKETQGEG